MQPGSAARPGAAHGPREGAPKAPVRCLQSLDAVFLSLPQNGSRAARAAALQQSWMENAGRGNEELSLRRGATGAPGRSLARRWLRGSCRGSAHCLLSACVCLGGLPAVCAGALQICLWCTVALGGRLRRRARREDEAIGAR